MKNEYSYLLTPYKLTIIGNGKHVQVESTNENFDEIKDLLKKHEFEKIIDIVDLQNQVKNYMSDKLEIENGIITYNGIPLHGKLIERILQFKNEGFEYKPLINFLENQLKNPSKTAVDSLYDFIEHGNMPITPDGCFLEYKCVNYDYKDCHSNTFDNSIGKICEMDRNECDEDRNITCSTGLHVCTFDYLKSFYSYGNKIMIVKVNPKDVVSVPFDYHNAKMRCCKYEVIDEYEEYYDNNNTEFFDDKGYFDDKTLYIENEGIYVMTKYYNDSLRKGVKVKVKTFNDEKVLVTRPRGGIIHNIPVEDFLKITEKC